MVVGLVIAPFLYADQPGVDNPNRASFNYMMNCQGCHGPSGQGTFDGSVPRMENFVGNFLLVEGGREFIVRVPGSANSDLDDAELAELLNWMLPRISSNEMPAGFAPYTAAEVGRLRSQPLEAVVETRTGLVRQMQASGLEVPPDQLPADY